MKKNNLIFVITLVIIFIVALGVFFIAKSRIKDLEGLIISKDNNIQYDSILLNNYDEYQTFLKNKNALGKLTADKFKDHDYLVDYVPYVKDMIIKNISIDVTDNGIHITYELNKDVANSKKLLINFIELDKGQITSLGEVTRSYNY